MKDKIYQQIEFAKGRLNWAISEDNKQEIATWDGYIQGLRYVLGLVASSESPTVVRKPRTTGRVAPLPNSAHSFTEGSDIYPPNTEGQRY